MKNSREDGRFAKHWQSRSLFGIKIIIVCKLTASLARESWFSKASGSPGFICVLVSFLASFSYIKQFIAEKPIFGAELAVSFTCLYLSLFNTILIQFVFQIDFYNTFVLGYYFFKEDTNKSVEQFQHVNKTRKMRLLMVSSGCL